MLAGRLDKRAEQTAAVVGLRMALHAEHPAPVRKLDRLGHPVRVGPTGDHETLAEVEDGLVVVAAGDVRVLADRTGRQRLGRERDRVLVAVDVPRKSR